MIYNIDAHTDAIVIYSSYPGQLKINYNIILIKKIFTYSILQKYYIPNISDRIIELGQLNFLR